ncbi:MAG: DUF4097 family beta strand repeat protein [Clostridia bacterium]|nr:DUF4097 family beta strand repeat protein [Clostridia bacterium]
MGKFIKIALSIAIGLILFGGVLFVGAMTVNGWDFTKLGTIKYVTHTHEISDNFQDISIISDTTDVTFVKSDDGSAKVVCFVEEKISDSVAVIDGVLNIKVVDERKWYEQIGINFNSSKMTVYLPETEYQTLKIDSSTSDVEIPNAFSFSSVDVSLSTGDVKFAASVSEQLKIKITTGDIYLENTSVGSLDVSGTTGDIKVVSTSCTADAKIKVSTGKVKLTDVTCKSIAGDGSTGDFVLKNVIASEKLSIKLGTGDVSFDRCDAAEIYVKTSTGDVKGSFRSDKSFFTESGTGHINVPKGTAGGRCEITTGTGDIKIEILQ